MEREIRRGQGGKSGQRTAEEGNLWSAEGNSEKEEDPEDGREKLGPAERERERGPQGDTNFFHHKPAHSYVLRL